MGADEMRVMASESHASTWKGEIPDRVIDGYEERHPVTKGMTAPVREVWDSLGDADRRMIQSDRAYFGISDDGSEEDVSFMDVIGLRHVD